MIRCASCGQENPEGARFCNSCGGPLAAAPSGGEVRKTVTVLFADVVSSTSRGEQADPESTRRMLARYFDVMRRIVERHGGTVEKFIGDAVMAVFGIPVLHEDDALRAVRAADEIGSAIGRLNEELASASWPPLALRIGVNTGEVVAGDPAGEQAFVTGDAVNVAARLEQAASAGEVILGAATYRLVRDAILAEPMEGLELKGKAEPVAAYRLTGIGETSPARRHDTPLVGRERELRLLADAFRRATEERACYLFTLLGPAGVGKSRLVHEFLGQVADDAQVLRGRCLPYGEGITFWPVIELIQGAAGILPSDPPEGERDKVEALLADADERDAIMARLASTLGLPGEVMPTEETFWGVRKLLEAVAARQPLIAVIDDLHWAEPTLLDLIDHIADWSREAPILLLAIARPELLDTRPMWSGGKMNATTILLEPLSAEASTELIGNLISDAAVAGAVQARISETAEGNPLFVEELVAMLLDQGILRQEDGGWRALPELQAIAIPPTVSALVAARLDHLEPPERDLIGRASVVGKIFQRSAVAELSPPERRDDLGLRLMTLVRKELVRPDRSGTTGDEAFRFRHILVRDAAYGSLPKEQRADLHARFADWLQRVAPDRLVEYEEVIAYHLEQAHAYRAELGLTDEVTASLGERAAAHLRSAGMRAVARNDVHAAANLLTRAASLLHDRDRGEILLHIAACQAEMGDLAGAALRYAEARAAAERAGDEELALRAELTRLELSTITDPTVDEAHLLALADELEAMATSAGIRWGRIAAEHARATVYLNGCRWMDELRALERARDLMEPGENPWLWNHTNYQIWNSLRYGPVPAHEAIARIQAEASAADASTNGEAFIAPLAAIQGRFDEARRMAAELRAYLRERGMAMRVGDSSLSVGYIEMLAGEDEVAHRDLSSGIAILHEMGETGVLSTLAAMDANALYHLGRRDEMEAAIQLARASGAPHDIATQAEWRWAAAMAAADDGRPGEAQRLIDEAVEMVEPTDFRELRGGTFEALAHVEARAGSVEGWKAALERALNEHVSKGNLVGEQQVRELLRGDPPGPVSPETA